MGNDQSSKASDNDQSLLDDRYADVSPQTLAYEKQILYNMIQFALSKHIDLRNDMLKKLYYDRQKSIQKFLIGYGFPISKRRDFPAWTRLSQTMTNKSPTDNPTEFMGLMHEFYEQQQFENMQLQILAQAVLVNVIERRVS